MAESNKTLRIEAEKLQVTYYCPSDKQEYTVSVSAEDVWYSDYDNYSDDALEVIYDINCICGNGHEIVHRKPGPSRRGAIDMPDIERELRDRHKERLRDDCCEYCWTYPAIAWHHRYYPQPWGEEGLSDGKGFEDLYDMMYVCNRCHSFIHGFRMDGGYKYEDHLNYIFSHRGGDKPPFPPILRGDSGLTMPYLRPGHWMDRDLYNRVDPGNYRRRACVLPGFIKYEASRLFPSPNKDAIIIRSMNSMNWPEINIESINIIKGIDKSRGVCHPNYRRTK